MDRMTDSMARVRAGVTHQLGEPDSVDSSFDPEKLVRFSPDLPKQLSPEERELLVARAKELEPWLQGPFLLGGDLVVGGVWRIDSRWITLREHVPDLSGKRVLDVGSNAGFDPFMFNLLGAEEVLACEPFEFIEQARFLESLYRTGVNFQQIGWQELDPSSYGSFDLVHCHGVLYHEVDPIALLRRLYEMTAPGGTLIFGSMMLADPLCAGLSRFVPRSYFRDDSWWWVPGPVALHEMIESVGFEVEYRFGDYDGPPGEFSTINGYFRAARPGGGSSRLSEQVREANLTYLDSPKIEFLESCAQEVRQRAVPGDFLEMGVALGGSGIILAGQLDGERRFEGYDVFGMIPPPSEADPPSVHERYETIVEGRSVGIGGNVYYGYLEDLYERVVANFARFGQPVDGDRVKLHRGPFEETLHPSRPVALAHVDCDWYEPVRLCIERVWPRLAPGALMVFDDYNEYGGCAQAVDEFVAAHSGATLRAVEPSALVVKS